jgi:hypothetical protein
MARKHNQPISFREEIVLNHYYGRFSGLRIILLPAPSQVYFTQWRIAGFVLAYGGGTALAFNQTSLSVNG